MLLSIKFMWRNNGCFMPAACEVAALKLTWKVTVWTRLQRDISADRHTDIHIYKYIYIYTHTHKIFYRMGSHKTLTSTEGITASTEGSCEVTVTANPGYNYSFHSWRALCFETPTLPLSNPSIIIDPEEKNVCLLPIGSIRLRSLHQGCFLY